MLVVFNWLLLCYCCIIFFTFNLLQLGTGLSWGLLSGWPQNNILVPFPIYLHVLCMFSRILSFIIEYYKLALFFRKNTFLVRECWNLIFCMAVPEQPWSWPLRFAQSLENTWRSFQRLAPSTLSQPLMLNSSSCQGKKGQTDTKIIESLDHN